MPFMAVLGMLPRTIFLGLKSLAAVSLLMERFAWGPQALLLIGGKRKKEPRSPVRRGGLSFLQ